VRVSIAARSLELARKEFLALLIAAWGKVPEAAIIKGWSVFRDL
jgi:hypothetical protein